MHLFRPDRELLELNAMEMDAALIKFFTAIVDGEDQAPTLSFVNDAGVERKIKVNLQEKLLQGRGINGFFSPYADAEYLTIRMLDNGAVRIGTLDQPVAEWDRDVTEALEVKTRMNDVLHALSLLKQQSEAWFRLYDRSREFAARSENLICLPHLREVEPFEYQIRTVTSVIGRFKGRALLCDEVGLGKTVEAGVCLQEYIMRGLARKVLILVPPSLVNQWHEEMKRKFNQDFIRSDDPAFTKLGEEAWRHYPKVIASITTAKRAKHANAISLIHYDMVIVDEAHHVKNRNTVAWKFVNSLNKKYMLLLTATPVQNSLEELYNLITLLRPGQLQTYRQFHKNFVEDNQGIEVKNADKLKLLLSEVMIRNRRSNVDVKFTQRKASTRIIEPSPRERQLYVDLSAFVRTHYMNNHPVFSRFMLKSLQEQMGSTFASLTGTLEKLAGNEGLTPDLQEVVRGYHERALAIAAAESRESRKIDELARIVAAFGDKMLIFTKYRTTLELIGESLRNRGVKVAEFHGGLKRMEKEREVAFFREEANVLVSTEVGGEGRNLQFCNGIVNFDLPWNPMAIEQRIGRIHRIGQARDVFVYNLAAQNTLEHHMLNVLDRKINMFELVIGEVDMILGDIEESEEFSDLVMNAWVRSENDAMIEREMDVIGEKLLSNKNKLDRVKALDDRIFA